MLHLPHRQALYELRVASIDGLPHGGEQAVDPFADDEHGLTDQSAAAVKNHYAIARRDAYEWRERGSGSEGKNNI